MTWREELHPRGPDGEFVRGDQWAGALFGLARRQNFLQADTDWEHVMRATPPPWSGDNGQREIYTLQGYHGRPRTVDAQELRTLARQPGAVELWKGVDPTTIGGKKLSAQQYADTYAISDEHYPAHGLSGAGTYVTTDKARAKGYGPGMIHMVLLPGSRVANLTEIGRLRREIQADPNAPPKMKEMAADMGRLAAALGYDAIEIPGTGDYMILNRTAVVVQQ